MITNPILSGGGDKVTVRVRANAINRFAYMDFGGISELEIIATSANTSLYNSYGHLVGVKKITLSSEGDGKLTNLYYAFSYNDGSLEEVCFNCETDSVTDFQVFFRDYPPAKRFRITGIPLDFSSALSSNEPFRWANGLESMRIKPNTVSCNLRLDSSRYIDNDTIISVANSFNASATTKTCALHNDIKAKLSTIYGNVVDGLFVYSETGTMNLQDFITNVKGWTIA